MGVSDLIKKGEKYLGADPAPEGFAAFWEARADLAVACAQGQQATLEEVGIETPQAVYRRMSYTATDGAALRARVILPKSEGPHPCILVWHDLDRGTRGWFQLSRYVAAGYAVVHPEYRAWSRDITAGWQEGPEGMVAVQLIDDALVAASLAGSLPGVDQNRLMTHGEGFGGLFALAAAALARGVAKCAVVNVMPADVRGAWEQGASGYAYEGVLRHFREDDPCAERAGEFFSALGYVDAANFSALLPKGCELLDGICLMDAVARPLTQYAAYNRAGCVKRLAAYPKYGHERLNDFENRLLAIMHFGE